VSWRTQHRSSSLPSDAAPGGEGGQNGKDWHWVLDNVPNFGLASSTASSTSSVALHTDAERAISELGLALTSIPFWFAVRDFNNIKAMEVLNEPFDNSKNLLQCQYCVLK